MKTADRSGSSQDASSEAGATSTSDAKKGRSEGGSVSPNSSSKSAKKSSSSSTSKAGATQKRADMGAALRKSGTGRRPVDFFFQPSEPSPSAADDANPAGESEDKASTPERPSISGKADRGGAEDASTTPRKKHEVNAPLEDTKGNSSVSRETEEQAAASDDSTQLISVPGAHFGEIGVEEIHPNRKQPRQEFDEDEMEELAHSIREIGVLQPIVVRRSREEGDAKYELVMGERRWRASQRAKMETIPAIVRDTQDVDLLRDALLENLHRSQLNPLEEAAAYQQLLHEFGTTQEELAQRIGRSRPQISNTIRLLRLPALVQRRVAAGILSAGHARALLVLEDPAAIERLAQRIVAEGLSVRAVEEIAQAGESQKKEKPRKATPANRHHERLDYIADAFADKLDTSVKINLGSRKGKMTIEFASVDDLNRIISVLDPEIERD